MKFLILLISISPVIPLQLTYNYKFPQYAYATNYVSEKYGIENRIIENLIEAESSGKHWKKGRHIRSCGKYTRAIGLIQIVPECHQECENLTIPRDNLECGIRYLSELTKRHGSINIALYYYGGWSGKPYKEAYKKYIKKVLYGSTD